MVILHLAGRRVQDFGAKYVVAILDLALELDQTLNLYIDCFSRVLG